MLRADAPLLVNPRPSWHKLSWFAEFIRNIAHYERNTVATTALAIAAREHLFAWAAREHIDFDLKTRGILHIYRSKAGFAHAGKVSKLLAQGGLERRAVTPAEMRAIEPTLAGDYYGGYFTPSDATGDIHQFTTGLAAAAERMGVQCLFGRDVESVTHQGGRVRICTAHATEHETRVFDAVVVCAGTASRAIAAGLGDRLNIYPVKGYSITVQLNDALSRSSAPTVSLLDDETKLVSSRLGEHRLRVAGTAEFNGYNRDIRADRIQPLTDWVAQCFPGVRTENVVPWAGLRPMMPDMMPRIGRGKAPCVFYNTGHGHLGWTLCAITAEMVADAVQGSPARALAVPVLRPQAV
jgi:D-amino-acid dehydrogenase